MYRNNGKRHWLKMLIENEAVRIFRMEVNVIENAERMKTDWPQCNYNLCSYLFRTTTTKSKDRSALVDQLCRHTPLEIRANWPEGMTKQFPIGRSMLHKNNNNRNRAQTTNLFRKIKMKNYYLNNGPFCDCSLMCAVSLHCCYQYVVDFDIYIPLFHHNNNNNNEK